MNEGLQVLGVFDEPEPIPETTHKRNTADVWYSLDRRDLMPHLLDIHCCGYRYTPTVHFILYDSAQKVLSPFDRGPHTMDKKLRNSDLSTLQIAQDLINRARFVSNRLEPFDSNQARPCISLFHCLVPLLSLIRAMASGIEFLYTHKLPFIHKSISDTPFQTYLFDQLLVRSSMFDEWEFSRKTIRPVHDPPKLSADY